MGSKIIPHLNEIASCGSIVVEAIYQFTQQRGSFYFSLPNELVELTTIYFIGFLDCLIGEHVYQT